MVANDKKKNAPPGLDRRISSKTSIGENPGTIEIYYKSSWKKTFLHHTVCRPLARIPGDKCAADQRRGVLDASARGADAEEQPSVVP